LDEVEIVEAERLQGDFEMQRVRVIVFGMRRLNALANALGLFAIGLGAGSVALGQPVETASEWEAVQDTFSFDGEDDHNVTLKSAEATEGFTGVGFTGVLGEYGEYSEDGPETLDGGPANDFCANAFVIAGSVISYNPPLLNTTTATLEPCENQESCSGIATSTRSVYYTYTPIYDGIMEVNTFGSSFDTMLSVWSQCGFSSPPFCFTGSQLACNNNFGFGTASLVSVPVTAGEDYIIKASSAPGAPGGNLDLNMQFIPANDVCLNATPIDGVAFNPPLVPTQNADAENCEAAESCELNNVGTSNSVWYEFSPPCGGTISLNTNGSNYDTVLSVFDGCGVFVDPDAPCDLPEEIACDDDAGIGLQSQLVDVPVEPGVTYYIKVADYNTSPGGGLLDFNFMFSGATPPVAEIDEPVAYQCVCGFANIVGSAFDPDGGSVSWTLDARPVSGGAWTLIDSGVGSAMNDHLASWNAAGLAHGEYLIRLTVENACGLTSTDVVVVRLDTLFNTLELRQPPAGPPTAIRAGKVCIDGTAWDTCFTSYRVEVRPVGGSFVPVDPSNPVVTSTVINDPLASWATSPGNPPDGDYEIRLSGTDFCENTASVTHPVTLDNTPPTVEIVAPLSCAYVDGVVNIIGTVNDAHLRSWVLQYTGGETNGWVTIANGTNPVINGLLAQWDTTDIEPCAYTLRLVAVDDSIFNCDDPLSSEVLVSVNAGDLCPVDLDGDGDQDLLDYGLFQQCHTGPNP
jgi:hypothetical protein